MNTALRATIAIVVLSGAVVLSSGVAAAAQSPVRTDSSSDIDAWVEQRMAARGLPGTAVAVVRGGEVVHLAGYGVADDTGRTVTPDTPFILGSASKPFTGVVIGQLVEEGLLSWDEPVWPHLSHLVDEPPDGFETATVEQLLTHTAGLGMIVGTAGTVTIHEGPDALDRRVDELLSRRLAAAPGEGFNYSNAGFMLLAAVTEQVTGRPFADELGDRVFVQVHHRHAGPVPGAKFALAAASGGGELIGVALVGRPVARALDDDRTLEVRRLCTTGAPNACSLLLGAAWRAAKALGYRRLVTYTLATESGASLRAAGFRATGRVAARSWSCPSRPRIDRHPLVQRVRWEICR
jgi:CubicO group peptidase (beta-lactamase class C family)